MADEMDELWKGADYRAGQSERRTSYSGGYRCWGCNAFVAGPTVTCGACGQIHGGIYHKATASR